MMTKREEVLQAALDCGRDVGYRNMTREEVGAYAQCAPSLVSHYFGSMRNLRLEVMRHAIDVEDPYVLAQGMVFKDPIALATSDELKEQVLEVVRQDTGSIVCLS